MRLRAADKITPIPIVLDPDIGSDMDDAFALALVLDSPELGLRAVTTVSAQWACAERGRGGRYNSIEVH